ncbi:septum formation initiator [Novosphingobium sp. YJ-S2-02]|uniref:Septum formation initiator n=1 Tax=Novosphingobium aureum TaxID=2792964 RepID=A0A931HFR1_9SPHN|nr:septum formation initiator [Novosphingobium aureum]MBH0114531.1 septum formation initiator [Novosphingobium aureum]
MTALTKPLLSGRTGDRIRGLAASAALALLAASAGPAQAGAHTPPAAQVLAERDMQAPAGRSGEKRDKGRLHAELGTFEVSAGEGAAPASAGYLSYARADEASAKRPVIFAFNGGPGASASFLHMGLLGPRLARVPQDPTAADQTSRGIVAGSAALYDLADVVFIDPPGTGFSQRPEGEAAAPYNTVAGDAAAVADLVAQWLEAHHRTDAPIYILGESYGTIRAVAMLDALAERGLDKQVHGVVLLGQALNMIETSQRPDNVVTYAVSLPTLSAIACYHGMLGQGCNAEAITAEAAQFARSEYLPALYRGRDLPEAERERLAARLEALTGIPASFYRAHDLRISKERFRVELLRGKGLVTGRYDARYTAPRPDEVTVMMPGDPSSPISTIFGKAMSDYLASDLQAPGAADYKVLARFEGGWTYGSADSPFADWPFMADVERHAADNACLRLFVGTGIYDTTTTIGAADYLFAQSSLPRERYVNARYVGGHVFYSDDGSRARFQSDLAAFLKADTCP